MLTIVTPAPDYNLLTIAELRAAVGVTGNEQDAVLATLGAQISAAIAASCGVATASTAKPTLREEVVEESMRIRGCTQAIYLSRQPIVSVTSVVEAGTTLGASDYEIDGPRLLRLSGDDVIDWALGKIIVEYTAGWATVPDDLKLAASKLAALVWAQNTRDPLARSERVRTEGVEEIQTDYWVGPINSAALPADVADLLGPYNRYYLVG